MRYFKIPFCRIFFEKSENIPDQRVYECRTLGQKLGYDNYGTIACLTLWFCHFFQEIFRGQLMRSRSLHNSGSSTRREARLIPIRWLVAMLPMLMSNWVRRWWALSNGLRPCAMLGTRSHQFWLGGQIGGRGGGNNSMSRTRRTSRREGLMFRTDARPYVYDFVFSFVRFLWFLINFQTLVSCISMTFLGFHIIFSI